MKKKIIPALRGKFWFCLWQKREERKKIDRLDDADIH